MIVGAKVSEIESSWKRCDHVCIPKPSLWKSKALLITRSSDILRARRSSSLYSIQSVHVSASARVLKAKLPSGLKKSQRSGKGVLPRDQKRILHWKICYVFDNTIYGPIFGDKRLLTRQLLQMDVSLTFNLIEFQDHLTIWKYHGRMLQRSEAQLRRILFQYMPQTQSFFTSRCCKGQSLNCNLDNFHFRL